MNRNDDVELPADWDDDSDVGTERRRGRRAALIAFGLVAVLVIGASAGGVAALQAVLGALPAKLPVPVLAVLHLPRDRTSRIAEVLAPYCALDVREAEDKQPLQAATVTFAAPDYHLLVEDAQTIALSMDEPVLFSRPAIDPLFESAAAIFGPQLLAVLLYPALDDTAAGRRQQRWQ